VVAAAVVAWIWPSVIWETLATDEVEEVEAVAVVVSCYIITPSPHPYNSKQLGGQAEMAKQARAPSSPPAPRDSAEVEEGAPLALLAPTLWKTLTTAQHVRQVHFRTPNLGIAHLALSRPSKTYLELMVAFHVVLGRTGIRQG